MVTTKTYNFIQVYSNHTIQAEFEQRTLTVVATAGTGGTVTGGGTYVLGDEVTITATPSTGYRFVRWNVTGGTSDVNPAQFTVQEPMLGQTVTYEAVFAEKQDITFTLLAAVRNVVPVSLVGQTYRYRYKVNDGDWQSATFETADGSEVSTKWTIAGHDATRNSAYGTTVSLKEGDTIQFQVQTTPNHNTFVSWTNPTATWEVTTETATITNVTADMTVIAQYECETFTITAGVTGTGGTISPNGEVTAYYREGKSFTITANAGYEIKQILVDGQPISLE